MVKVHFEFLISLQDQPERRSATGFMGGSGQYSARWGYSCNFTAIKSKLVPCASCLDKLLSHSLHSQGKCSSCTNWEIIGTCSTILKSGTSDKCPDKCKKETLSSTIKPFAITFDLMKHVLLTSHTELVNQIWTKEHVNAYLRLFCVNTKCVDSIILHAENELSKNTLSNDIHTNSNKRDYNAMICCKLKNPPFYEPCIGPATYRRSIKLTQHLDVTMHLVFLGIVRTVTKKIQKWTKLRGSYNNFIKHMNYVFDILSFQPNLDWFEVRENSYFGQTSCLNT